MPDNCSKCKPYAPFNFDLQYFYNKQCNQCELKGCSCAIDSKCVYYNGPNLPCSGIENKDTLEDIIQKIDEQICAISGDYSQYNFNCLIQWCGCVIDTEAEFVDKITQFVCEINDKVNDVIDNIIPNEVQQLQNQINDIVNPEIVCPTAGVIIGDTLKEVLTKYCTKLLFLNDAIDITGVDWSQCFIVNNPPTSIKEGFDLLIDQICQINGGNVVLPVFNNIGSCLANPGANDSLVNTIEKIKTRLCQTPTFDINALNWDCTVKPSIITTDLQAAFQTVLDTTNDYIKNKLTFSGDFIVTQTDVNDPCAGKTLELAVPINQDRFVASNALDNAPGTLIDKLEAGLNIVLDDLITPGKVTISSSSSDTYKVKADSLDIHPDFLDLKVKGQLDSNAIISISTSYNGGTEQVDFTPVVDGFAFPDFILDSINSDGVLKAKFCGIVGDCVGGGNAWVIDGNAGTVDGVNFIGTTDNVPLSFRVNNQKAGKIDHISVNTSLGYRSLNSNALSGLANTALGSLALLNLTSGGNNVGIGAGAVFGLTTGSKNVGIGNNALFSYSSGSNNTSVGHNDTANLINGSENSSLGYNASAGLTLNGTTAIGAYATANGANSTAIGFRSLVDASNCMVLGSINGVNGAVADTNVGIGVTVPTQKLHVVGTPRFVTGNEGLNKVWTSDANGVGDWQIPIADTNIYNSDGVLPENRIFDGGGFNFTMTNVGEINLDSQGKLGGSTWINLGDFVIAGKLNVNTGINKSIGTATLVGGTVVVNTDNVTAGCKIFVTCDTPGGVQGFLSVPTASYVLGVSFVINSSSATDTSTVRWWIIG